MEGMNFMHMGIKSCIVKQVDSFGRIVCRNGAYPVDNLQPVWGDKEYVALRDPANPEVAYIVDKGDYAAAIVSNRMLESKCYAARN